MEDDTDTQLSKILKGESVTLPQHLDAKTRDGE